jgi:hypothetical protein
MPPSGGIAKFYDLFYFLRPMGSGLALIRGTSARDIRARNNN